MATPKINAWANAPISHPHVVSLQLQNEERWSWSNCSWSYLLSLTSVISTSATRMPTLTSTYLLSLFIGLFTLYLSRKLQETCKWIHGVSYSPTPEESYLSDAGLATDNLHFVVLPPYHSFEFVPLGWWCTWLTWPVQPYRDESPLLE